jgi:DNA-directed RNA polymerase subunit F
MARINKIERFELAPRVLALTAEGKTTHEIARILTEEGDGAYTISQSTVARWLKDVRKERSEQTRQVVHDYIQKTVPTDLESINEVQAWLIAQFRSLAHISIEAVSEALAEPITEEMFKKLIAIFPADPLDLRTRAELGMKIVRIVDTKLKYAGVLEDDESGFGFGEPVDLDEYRFERAKPKEETASG